MFRLGLAIEPDRRERPRRQNRPTIAVHRCAAADSWRYDDANDPRRIALCPATCERVQKEPKLRVEVQFGCEDVVVL